MFHIPQEDLVREARRHESLRRVRVREALDVVGVLSDGLEALLRLEVPHLEEAIVRRCDRYREQYHHDCVGEFWPNCEPLSKAHVILQVLMQEASVYKLIIYCEKLCRNSVWSTNSVRV